jgi:hypothetical protein
MIFVCTYVLQCTILTQPQKVHLLKIIFYQLQQLQQNIEEKYNPIHCDIV